MTGEAERSVDGIRHPTSGKRFLLGFEAYGRLQEDRVTLGAFGTPASRYGALVFGCHRKIWRWSQAHGGEPMGPELKFSSGGLQRS